MKTKKPFIKLFSNLLLATLLAASGSAYAAGAGAAQIAVFASGLSISSPGTANVTSLTLRIAGPDDSVTNLKSNGTAIDWSAAGMVDGNYRYEVYVTTSIDGSENTETTITRGLMKIFQGMIVDEQNNAAVEYDTYDLLAGLKAESLGIANNLLDMLVPGAQAQSLTASGLVGGDVVFDSTDTSDNRDWVISGKAMAGPPFSGNFTIIDDVDDAAYNNKTVFDIAHSLNNENSIIVDDNGDIGLANGGFFFDRSSKRMGINTITPAQGIHVLATSSKSSMALRMENTSESTWDIGQNSGGDYFVSIVTNGNSGPTGTMFEIDDQTGYVGIGTSSPATKLHVSGQGSGSVDQVMRLESAVPPQMTFLNSSSAGTGLWYFAMTSDDQFKVSYDGTGKVEAKFFQNGNLVIAGNLTQNSDRDSKKDIVAVDSKKVLDLVANLPISTWEYKADDGVTHMGPMAQDFHAAFGLGSTPKGISTIDTGGVALAAIKGLNEIVLSKDTEIKSLRSELSANSTELAELKEMVHALATKDQVASVK